MPVDNGNDDHRYRFGPPRTGWPSFDENGKRKPIDVNEAMQKAEHDRELRADEPLEGPLCLVESCPRLAHPRDGLCAVHFWERI